VPHDPRDRPAQAVRHLQQRELRRDRHRNRDGAMLREVRAQRPAHRNAEYADALAQAARNIDGFVRARDQRFGRELLEPPAHAILVAVFGHARYENVDAALLQHRRELRELRRIVGVSVKQHDRQRRAFPAIVERGLRLGQNARIVECFKRPDALQRILIGRGGTAIG